MLRIKFTLKYWFTIYSTVYLVILIMKMDRFRFDYIKFMKLLLLAFLTFTVIFTIYSRPVQSINTVLITPDMGPVETEVTISGTDASPFSQVKIYWESINQKRLIGTATADNNGGFLVEEIVIPEGTAGEHWIIVVDSQTLNNGVQFTIVPQIKLKVVTNRAFNTDIETSVPAIRYNIIKVNHHSSNWFIL